MVFVAAVVVVVEVVVVVVVVVAAVVVVSRAQTHARACTHTQEPTCASACAHVCLARRIARCNTAVLFPAQR